MNAVAWVEMYTHPMVFLIASAADLLRHELKLSPKTIKITTKHFNKTNFSKPRIHFAIQPPRAGPPPLCAGALGEPGAEDVEGEVDDPEGVPPGLHQRQHVPDHLQARRGTRVGGRWQQSGGGGGGMGQAVAHPRNPQHQTHFGKNLTCMKV